MSHLTPPHIQDITTHPMNRWLRLTLITSALHLAVATALFLMGFNLATPNRAGKPEAPETLTQISKFWNAPYFYLWSPMLEKNYPKPEEWSLRGVSIWDTPQYRKMVAQYRMRHRVYPMAIILLRSAGVILSTLLCGAALGALYYLAPGKKPARTA